MLTLRVEFIYEKAHMIKVLKNIFSFLIKYLVLIVLFALLIHFTKYYGDYCSSVYVSLFLLPFIAVCALIYIIALYAIDYKKKNYRTTHIVVCTFIIIFLTNFIIGYFSEEKEIFQKYIPESENGQYKLTLYKNESFKVYKQMNHGACITVGEYQIIKDTLKLDYSNKNIENLTDSTFTFSYKFNHTTKIYEPLKKGFKNLKSENLEL